MRIFKRKHVSPIRKALIIAGTRITKLEKKNKELEKKIQNARETMILVTGDSKYVQHVVGSEEVTLCAISGDEIASRLFGSNEYLMLSTSNNDNWLSSSCVLHTKHGEYRRIFKAAK
jgi:hypothetical protein